MSGETVKVIVRVRPLNEREKNLKCKSVINIETNRGQCSITNPNDDKSSPKSFFFDGAYDICSTTEQLYSDIVYPLVEGVTEGYNGTIFAYGQTGCGKSFTMQGISEPSSQRGVIPRSFDHIFETISVAEDTKFLVHASYLEIYNEDIRDLLAKDTKARLELKERPDKGVYVAGLSMHKVSNVTDCQVIMERGWKNRATGATLMNVDSSRSHSIFTIYLEMINADEAGEEHIRSGKLNLVDLAGSERQSKTGSTGDRLKEATKINLSLSALGNVISALVDGKSKHIPYRDSKLTRMLQDSLGGNTKTLMIACLSPADNNFDETISTLRYANRAKNIKNKPKINEDPKDALLRQYQEEINQLKLMLAGKIPTSMGPDQRSNSVNNSEKQILIEAEKQKIREEYEIKLEEKEAQYYAEAADKAKLRKEMNKLKQFYDNKLSQLDSGYTPQSNENMLYDNEPRDLVDELNGPVSIGHIERMLGTPDIFKGTITDSSVVFINPDGHLLPETMAPQKAVHIKSVPGPQQKITNKSELLNKLQALQSSMVGGEQVSNEKIKDRHTKRKKHAESKRRLLLELNEKMEDDGIMLGVFEDIQDELKMKSRQLSREKEKNTNLQQDILDMQSEFEKERCDYLESIRKLDQEKELLKAILDKVQSCIRKGCNYSNIDKIKMLSKYNEDSGKWILPQLKMEQTQLPSGEDDHLQRNIDDDHLYKKLSQRTTDPTQEYFLSKKSNHLLSQRNSPNVISNNVVPLNSSSVQRIADYPHEEGDACSSEFRAAEVHGQLQSAEVLGRRNVHRLDALSTVKKTRKKNRYVNDNFENDF